MIYLIYLQGLKMVEVLRRALIDYALTLHSAEAANEYE